MLGTATLPGRALSEENLARIIAVFAYFWRPDGPGLS